MKVGILRTTAERIGDWKDRSIADHKIVVDNIITYVSTIRYWSDQFVDGIWEDNSSDAQEIQFPAATVYVGVDITNDEFLKSLAGGYNVEISYQWLEPLTEVN